VASAGDGWTKTEKDRTARVCLNLCRCSRRPSVAREARLAAYSACISSRPVPHPVVRCANHKASATPAAPRPNFLFSRDSLFIVSGLDGC
jgi:hypothetical protein